MIAADILDLAGSLQQTAAQHQGYRGPREACLPWERLRAVEGTDGQGARLVHWRGRLPLRGQHEGTIASMHAHMHVLMRSCPPGRGDPEAGPRLALLHVQQG